VSSRSLRLSCCRRTRWGIRGAPSVRSTVSARTRGTEASHSSKRTARSRRREERKAYSGKEGSLHEDVVLHDTLASAVKTANGWRGTPDAQVAWHGASLTHAGDGARAAACPSESAAALLRTLAQLAQDELAEQLQAMFQRLQDRIAADYATVFPPPAAASASPPAVDGAVAAPTPSVPRTSHAACLHGRACV